MKNRLSIVVVVVLLFIVSVFNLTGCKKDSFSNEYENFEFTLNADNNSYSIDGKISSIEKRIEIPSKYKGKSVTVIPSNAFANYHLLTTVVIPTSITKIESKAFYKCESLNTVIYEGTLAEWETIAKKSDSFSEVDTNKVICSDGEGVLNAPTIVGGSWVEDSWLDLQK